MKSVAIMQPTFMPWIGYFALLDAVDVFIFLDNVQFTKPSWQMRNFLSGTDGPVLLSLSIARKPSKPLICDTRLAENGFEVKLIKKIAEVVGIDTATYLESELPVAMAEKSMRILKLTEYFDGDFYISPIGSMDYLSDSNHFDTSNIRLRFFNYEHPSYPQGNNEFLSHMSALEAFATVGPDYFLSLIRKGVNAPLTMQEVLESAHEKL